MRPFDDKEIEVFYDKDLAIPTRTIYAGTHTIGDTDEESGTDCIMAERVIKALHLLNSLGSDPITILMNDIGGDEYHGLAIYDAIKASKAPVDIIVYGSAMSMASVILQAARTRYVMPNATIMVHMGKMNMDVDQRDIEANTKEWNRMNSVVSGIYLSRMREKNPRYSTNQLKELLSTDRYLSPKEAIDIGLADKIYE